MIALQATCFDASAAGQAALGAAYRTTIDAHWAAPDAPVFVGSFVPGGAQLAESLGMTVETVENRIADGRWDPTGNVTWAARDAVLGALEGDAVAAPAAFLEVRLTTDAEECSESAIVRLDTRSGAVLIVHILPRC